MSDSRFQVREYPGNHWNVVDTQSNPQSFVLPVFVSMEYTAAVVCGALNNEIRRAEQMRIPLVPAKSNPEDWTADYKNYILSDKIDPRD